MVYQAQAFITAWVSPDVQGDGFGPAALLNGIGPVAPTLPLDANDMRPHVGQEHTSMWRWSDSGKLYHPNALQRT